MKDNILFILAHPINTLRVKTRQIQVAIEQATPPPGSSIEEFPGLPVQEAAKLMGLKKREGRGVQLEDWSPADQERLKRGELPKGHPEHPNI